MGARGSRLSRRALLLGLGASMFASADARALGENRYPQPVEISAEDIAWFHACRAEWVNCESGAPAIFPPEIDFDGSRQPEVRGDERAIGERLDRVACAFFLHGAFAAGRHAFSPPHHGHADFLVTPEHIKLLQITSWRGPAIDCKRPYGDFTYFEIDMARALGISIGTSPKGYAEISDEAVARMDALHLDMLFVLHAYLRFARIAPGRYFLPRQGLDGVAHPRCAPVTQVEIDAYLRAMTTVDARRRLVPGNDQIPDETGAEQALFSVP